MSSSNAIFGIFSFLSLKDDADFITGSNELFLAAMRISRSASPFNFTSILLIVFVLSILCVFDESEEKNDLN